MGGDGGVADKAREREQEQAHKQERDHAAALMARIRADDEQALAELIRTYTPKLLRVAVALLDRRDLAIDVTQDAFITLWDQRTTLRDDTNIPGYLARVVRNRSIDILRSDRRYRQLLDTAAQQIAESPAVVENAAEQTIEAAEMAREFWRMVEPIPERPRRVLVLHWYAHLSYAEIATLLGVKVETVHKLMYRATSKLAERYRPEA